MKKLLLLTAIFSLLLVSVKAQSTEEAAIKATIQQLFDGMRKGDSTMVGAVFHPTARLQSVFKNKEGKVVVKTDAISGFVKSIGTPHPEVYDERLLSYEIRIDEQMATAWTPYEFYVGDKFSHAGVDAFQLAKTEKGWQIIQITDTRRAKK